MADTFDKEKRSQIMRLVKSKKNKSTELKFIEFLRKNHITGWRRTIKLFGKPDFLFPKLKIAIFLDGCFWHGHTCRNTKPKSNEEYWTEKISRNKKRDIDVSDYLTKQNWHVIRIWECQLKDQNTLIAMLGKNKTDTV